MQDSMNFKEKLFTKYRKNGFMGVTKAILKRITGYNYFIKKKDKYMLNKILKLDDMKVRFEEIYKTSYWGSKDSASGVGSTLNYTRPLREWLIKKINDLDIKNVVDAPCGDFHWMKDVVKNVNVNYVGLDIVDALIAFNNKSYKNEKIIFETKDICNDQIPNCDLLIVRDCLFHLSYSHIDSFLRNIYKCEYEYLLTTTHIVEDNFSNSDIITGDFREINLFSRPFLFNRDHVIDYITEGHNNSLRKMILISKSNVPKSIL